MCGEEFLSEKYLLRNSFYTERLKIEERGIFFGKGVCCFL